MPTLGGLYFCLYLEEDFKLRQKLMLFEDKKKIEIEVSLMI